MGLLLRQVLATLCGVNQWCYAIFWKSGCQNPKLLIWEESHHELPSPLGPHASAVEKPKLPFAEWESCDISSSTSSQLELLISKMMMNNQVIVIGEGIVGRAAFTGNYEWILANSYSADVHPPKVSNEVYQQFSAGVQTIAVIPIHPHGVVQLGSSLAIMENEPFVNNVKSLILQLGCVPGALLADNHMAQESTERVGVPISSGLHVNLSGNYTLPNPAPLLDDSCNQSILSQASKVIGQPSRAQTGPAQGNPQSSVTTFQTLKLTNTLAKSFHGDCEPKIPLLMKSDDLFRGQLENGVVGAEVILSNPDAWLNQQVGSYKLKPGFAHKPVIVQSHANNTSLKPLEQQILSDAGVKNDSKSTTASDRLTMPYPRTNGGLTLNPCAGSLTYVGEFHNGVSSQIRQPSTPCSVLSLQKSVGIDHHSTFVAGIELQSNDSLKAEGVPLTLLAEQLSANGILSVGSERRYHSADGKHTTQGSAQKVRGNNLLQVPKFLSAQLDEQKSVDGHFYGTVPGCLKNAVASQTVINSPAKYEDTCVEPPSGEDLYDILGVDFKTKLLSGKWNRICEDGQHIMTQDISKDTFNLMNTQDGIYDFYSVNDGISGSGIFSETGTGHLLDAVVSRANSATKQLSDDNESCWTTLTKTSSSCIPNASVKYGRGCLSGQGQSDLFDLSKSVEKSGTTGSGSLRPGCGKNDVASCSQSASIYGSPLSSWVEQGCNLRCDSSISTAFSKKSNDSGKPNRKRFKPGENPRPRPKDRQMIQDRVKELREIVPNGAKCSIDALLERTIKHMLFLQSVTKHADKLKQTGESKIINKEGGLLLKDNFEGGATWAFEVGSQSTVCPIIVEDLNLPRQMLVEMLCEEQGLFLEIAELIRGLGLTILKGVMESRNDKIWARFAVEANRDVTRMEIFMSLVRLLEQTVKGSLSSVRPLDNNTMMAHHTFPQGASIPATGMDSNLQ